MESVQGSMFENIVNFRSGSIIQNIKSSKIVKMRLIATSKSHIAICLYNSNFNLHCTVVLDLVPCHDDFPSRAEVSRFYRHFARGKKGSIPHTLTYFSTSPVVSISFVASANVGSNTQLIMASESGVVNLFNFLEYRKWKHWKSIQTCQNAEHLSQFMFDAISNTMIWISVGPNGMKLRNGKLDGTPGDADTNTEVCCCNTILCISADTSTQAHLFCVRTGEYLLVSLPSVSNFDESHLQKPPINAGSTVSGRHGGFGSGCREKVPEPLITSLTLSTGQLCRHSLTGLFQLENRIFTPHQIHVVSTGKGNQRLSSVLLFMIGQTPESNCELRVSHLVMRANRLSLSPLQQVLLPCAVPCGSYIDLVLRGIEGNTRVILSIGADLDSPLYHASMDDLLKCLTPNYKKNSDGKHIWTPVDMPRSARSYGVTDNPEWKRRLNGCPSPSNPSADSDATQAMLIWEAHMDPEYSAEDGMSALPTYGACCLRSGEMWGLTTHDKRCYTTLGKEPMTIKVLAPVKEKEAYETRSPEHKHSRIKLYAREKWYHDVPQVTSSSLRSFAIINHPIIMPESQLVLYCKLTSPSGLPVVQSMDVLDQMLRSAQSAGVLERGGIDSSSLANLVTSHPVRGSAIETPPYLSPELLRAAILHLLFLHPESSDCEESDAIDNEGDLDCSLPRVLSCDGGGVCVWEISSLRAMTSPERLQAYFTHIDIPHSITSRSDVCRSTCDRGGETETGLSSGRKDGGAEDSDQSYRLFDLHDLCVSCVNVYQIPPYALRTVAEGSSLHLPASTTEDFATCQDPSGPADRRVYLEKTVEFLSVHHPLSVWGFLLSVLSTRGHCALHSPHEFVQFCRGGVGSCDGVGIAGSGIGRIKRRGRSHGSPVHITLKRCLIPIELVLEQLQARATPTGQAHVGCLQEVALLVLSLLGDVSGIIERLVTWGRVSEASELCCRVFAVYNTCEVRWSLGVDATVPIASPIHFPQQRSEYRLLGQNNVEKENHMNVCGVDVDDATTALEIEVEDGEEEDEEWGDTWQDASTSGEDEEEAGGGGLSWREVEGEDGRSECTRTDASTAGDVALLLTMWRTIGKQYRAMFKACFQGALNAMDVDLACTLVSQRPSPAMGGVGVGGGITDVEIVAWFDEVRSKQLISERGSSSKATAGDDANDGNGRKILNAGHLRNCIESLCYIDLIN